MVVRVLGDGEQMPKAPDLLVELANVVGALLGVTDDPDVLHHVVHVDRLIGHSWIPLDIAQGPLRLAILILVLLKGSPQDDPGLGSRRFRGLADIHLPTDAELMTVRYPAGAGCTFCHLFPESRTCGAIRFVIGISPLSSHANAVRSRRRRGNPDGRMGLLVGLIV